MEIENKKLKFKEIAAIHNHIPFYNNKKDIEL